VRYLTIDQICRAAGGKLLKGSRQSRADNISTDSRTVKPLELFVALRGPHFDGHDYVHDALARGAVGAVVDFSYTGHRQEQHRLLQGAIIAVDDTLKALGDIARYYRSTLSTRIVAITGSNGKTTTKAMTHRILSGEMECIASPKSFNNAVGVPATLFIIEPRHRTAVIEMGTSHPGEIEYLAGIARPNVAVITNVSAAHLEGLANPKGVAEEKAAILGGLTADGIAVFNRDDFWSREIEKRWNGPRLGFGIETDAEVRASNIRSDQHSVSFTCAGLRFSIPMLGRHNVYNALAAAAAARAVNGISWSAIRDRLRTFLLPEMRMQVERIGGLVLINDAYNANPASMLAALRTLAAMPSEGRRILVMGDMRELGEQTDECHRDLGRKAAASGVDVLWATGTDAARAADAALHCEESDGQPVKRMEPEQVFFSPDARDAARRLPEFLKPGDVVLIKGSRALKMEIVARAVKDRMLGQAATGLPELPISAPEVPTPLLSEQPGQGRIRPDV